MPVVSGIPVTHISTVQRYLFLNPAKKHPIFIVNYFCGIEYITDTSANLGFLVSTLHLLCSGRLLFVGSLAGMFNDQHG